MKHSPVVLLTCLTGLYALPALGATVSGTAAIGGYYGDGSPASISLSSNVDPVALNRIETVNGLGTGTVLGLVRVNGDTSGAFDLLALVQRAGTAQSSFHFSDTFTNTAGVAQSFQMAFVIAPGKLQTQIFEPFDPADDRYRASYDLAISLNGAEAFSSSASLFQGGAFTQTGTDLGGTLTHDGFSPDRWIYA